MRWADALRETGVCRRVEVDASEPNVVLMDTKFGGPKAFHAPEKFGWHRIKLRLADQHDDWEPWRG